VQDLTLKKQLMDDFKAAMKSHDEAAKNTISFVRAAIKQVEIDKRVELEDEDIIPIIAKQVKMRKDALDDFAKGGREDLIQSYQAEIEILNRYLPAQMTEEEIRKIIRETASDLGVAEGDGKKSMGRLMGTVMSKVKGRADGAEVRRIIEDFLS
jgi:hypothetical protein